MSRKNNSATSIAGIGLGLLLLTGSLSAHAQAPAGFDAGSAVQRSTTELPPAVEAVFSNPTPILVTSGAANNGAPYPSSITVSGLTGLIPFTPGSVRVTINNFSHTRPDDIGIVLVSPTGAVMLLQDGAGSTTAMSNVTYTISDTGAIQFPDTGAWAAGTYRPSCFYVGDSFPAPGPLTGYANPGPVSTASFPATFSSTFGGINPNGVWNLFVRDFNEADAGTIAGGWTLEISGGSTQHRAPLDFDGDNRTDDSVIRLGSSTDWYIQRSSTGFTGVSWGIAGDKRIPEDFDGDGKTDVAIFRAGVFYILRSSSNSLQVVHFGLGGDDPFITQDFDNDGIADPAVTRNEGGPLVHYILRSSLGFTASTLGVVGDDLPIRGDFDGDGRADVAVYRRHFSTPANTFFIVPSGGGPLRAVTFGNGGTDHVVPGDFDGDHRTDVAVWRGISFVPGAGNWYWLRSSDGVFAAMPFGQALDLPVPGDYDGDGRTDFAIFRPFSPTAFFHLNSTGGFSANPFGLSGDHPIAFDNQVR